MLLSSNHNQRVTSQASGEQAESEPFPNGPGRQQAIGFLYLCVSPLPAVVLVSLPRVPCGGRRADPSILLAASNALVGHAVWLVSTAQETFNTNEFRLIPVRPSLELQLDLAGRGERERQAADVSQGCIVLRLSILTATKVISSPLLPAPGMIIA